LSEIITNEKGQKVVEIDTIVFSSKRRIDWDGVEQYLKRYVGQQYRIDETDDLQVIPELIKIATNISFRENTEDKHSKNAVTIHSRFNCMILKKLFLLRASFFVVIMHKL
jgi:hypothetical protein